MGARFRVSSERLEKPEIEPTTHGLKDEQLNHYATEASEFVLCCVVLCCVVLCCDVLSRSRSHFISSCVVNGLVFKTTCLH